MASDNIVPSVLIPASPAFLRETLPKYDPPVNDFAEGRGRAFGSMGGAMMGEEVPHRELPPVFLSSSDRMRGTLHGEAPISEYLPRLKVSACCICAAALAQCSGASGAVDVAQATTCLPNKPPVRWAAQHPPTNDFPLWQS